jgi:hypothetical protein
MAAAAALVAVASVPLSRLASRLAKRSLGRMSGTSVTVVNDLGHVVQWIVYLVAFAVILSIMGVNVGFLSVIFVFALILGSVRCWFGAGQVSSFFPATLRLGSATKTG